jgi:hypothetical protein
MEKNNDAGKSIERVEEIFGKIEGEIKEKMEENLYGILCIIRDELEDMKNWNLDCYEHTPLQVKGLCACFMQNRIFHLFSKDLKNMLWERYFKIYGYDGSKENIGFWLFGEPDLRSMYDRGQKMDTVHINKWYNIRKEFIEKWIDELLKKEKKEKMANNANMEYEKALREVADELYTRYMKKEYRAFIGMGKNMILGKCNELLKKTDEKAKMSDCHVDTKKFILKDIVSRMDEDAKEIFGYWDDL